MEIKYIRNLNASHMVIDQIGDLKGWERCMVAHNAIEGILFAESVSENGVSSLWYDITGKHTLEGMLEDTKLDYVLLCRLLTGIYSAVEKLELLLLQIDDMILLPESIFFDHLTGDISFCYYPGNTEKLQDAFGGLIEYLLTKVDHKDKDAVSLIYDLYEQSRKKGYSMSALLKGIKLPYPREEAGQDIASCQREDNKELLIEDNEEVLPESFGEEVMKRDGIWKVHREGVLHFGGKEISLPKWFSVENIKNRFIRKKRETSVLKEEPFIFEPESENMEVTHPTILLSEIPKKIEGILYYEGENGRKDIVIDKFPFLIGSDKSCEGYLPSATVSRKHAKITRQEDIYFIEDLNSSNGTYVGGEMLNYRVRMSLQKDEIILFADEKFRFS